MARLLGTPYRKAWDQGPTDLDTEVAQLGELMFALPPEGTTTGEDFKHLVRRVGRRVGGAMKMVPGRAFVTLAGPEPVGYVYFSSGLSDECLAVYG